MNTSGRTASTRSQFAIAATTILLVTMASLAWAAANLNSSKSNVYRVTYDTTAVTAAQATAVLHALDKIGPGVNEAGVRRVLQQQGVNLSAIRKISIVPPDRTRKEPLILLLTNPADEAQALAAAVKITNSSN